METIPGFPNITTSPDGRYVITCGLPMTTTSVTPGDWHEDRLAFEELGCEVRELGRNHYEVTLPAGLEIEVMPGRIYDWATFIVGDYLLTLGKQPGTRLRSLRRWSKEQFREWRRRLAVPPELGQKLSDWYRAS